MGRRRKKFPKKRKKIENDVIVPNLFEEAKMVNDCHESVIAAANQSELEATRDQRQARETSGKPFTSGMDSAHDWRERVL